MENLENINLGKYTGEFLCLDKMHINDKDYLYLIGYNTPELLVVEQRNDELIQSSKETTKVMMKEFTKRLISKQND
ncbi:unknown [Clostridium sp. CAG:710]|nr:unknown [Clostridium sp. CAG:710]